MKTKATILIIDDDEFLLDMYSLKFRQSGWGVDIAMNPTEAIEKIKDGNLSLNVVLLDLVMPNMDGFDFLEVVKKENLLKDSQLVVLSNLGQQENIDKAMKLGASGYLVKAYLTPVEVVDKVSELLEKKK